MLPMHCKIDDVYYYYNSLQMNAAKCLYLCVYYVHERGLKAALDMRNVLWRTMQMML